jgi:hypothetical protein
LIGGSDGIVRFGLVLVMIGSGKGAGEYLGITPYVCSDSPGIAFDPEFRVEPVKRIRAHPAITASRIILTSK